MPPREWRFRAQDMLEALARIRQYTQDLDEEAFRASPMVIDAVIRNLAVLGEAARNVPDQVRQRSPEIPWQKIQSMRNFIVHEYFGVSLEILWATTKDDLPALEPHLRSMLEDTTG